MEKDQNIVEINIDNEEKDYFEYTDQPEKLFPLAQEQFNNNDFVKGLIILDKSINYALEKYGGEDKIEMAQFYNKYANGLIQKLIYSDKELLNMEKDKKMEEKESEGGNSPKNRKLSEDEEGNEEMEESDENTEAVEREVAYENLQAANRILTKYLKEYNVKEDNTLDNAFIECYLELSETYYQLASLEKYNLDFQKSDKYYTLSSKILVKYGNKFSRKLAGLYFEQAQILDLNPIKCLLVLFKSKIIMEHYLQKEIDKIKLNIKIDIDEKDIDLDYISYDNANIFKNKEIFGNKELIEASESNAPIKELLDIIQNVNNKIEDVISELKQYDIYLKGKNQIINDKENQNTLINNNSTIKIMEKGKTIKIELIKKKRDVPFGCKDDLKVPEDFNSKEKININNIKI
jgi:hypothetical protein